MTKTPTQQAYYDSVVKAKRATKKRKYIINPKLPMVNFSTDNQNEKYIYNCIYWVQEYFAGRTDIKNFEDAILNLQRYAYLKEIGI